MTERGDAILVLDLGTHKCTATALDGHGQVVANVVSDRYPTYRDSPGHAEQDPNDWWLAAKRVIRGVLDVVPGGEVAGGITVGHGPSHLPIGADRQPLGRSLIWQDTRAREEARWIDEHTTVEQRFEALGLHLPIAPGMGPAKLLWLRDHESERYARTTALIQPKDYITLRLTGELVSDRYGMKDLVHAGTGEFDALYAEALGLRRDLIPAMQMPWSRVGRTTSEQQPETGLPAGIPVGCGTIDAFSGLIGSGGQDDGDVCDVSGTSEIIGLVRNAPAAPFESFLCYPLIEGFSVVFGVTRASGDSIDWFVNRIARADDIGEWIGGFEQRQVGVSAAEAGSLLFWPYLDGERSPHWNADLRGMFLGLDMNSDVDTLARAVFDGVALSVRHNLELLEQRTGTTPARMWVGGGTARSRLFNQIKSDATGLEVIVPEVHNPTARGAAAMMHVALGRVDNVLEGASRLVGVCTRIRPRDEWRARYDRLMPVFRDMSERMAPACSELASIRAAT